MSSEKVAVKAEKAVIAQYFSFNAKYIAISHALFAYLAFLGALATGCWLHYYKIVQNASYGYPDEWFPSVSATIGDRYPERSIFQIMIAMTSGPRFLLVFFNFFVLYRPKSIAAYTLLISGLLRTFTCGGWVYITSTDDHDWHDVFMISYLVLTIPWTVTVSKLSPKGSKIKRGRVLTALAFFGMLVPLVYLFIQHKVHDVPGAYSYYAYVEWSLVLLDVAFDTWSVIDFSPLEIRVYGNKLELATPPISEKEEGKKEETIVKERVPLPSAEGSSLVQFAIQIVNSFVFWTSLTALFACVWYFPLWHMGISGYEAVIVVLFIGPLLVLLPPFSFAKQYPFVFRTLAVFLGIGAYKVQDPEQKLMAVAAATGVSALSITADLINVNNRSQPQASYIVSFVLGLLGTAALKYLFYSNNPAWPIMHKENGGYNEIAFFITLVAALFTKAPSYTEPQDAKREGGSFFLAAFGLGSYVFALHFLLSDSSTLVMWTWDGYPITGPTPINGGLIFSFAAAAGVLASAYIHPNVLSGPLYSLVCGAGSAGVLYFNQGWVGYSGATVLVFYIASIALVIGQSVIGYCPIALLFVAFFIHILLSLGSVWIVAYAFVPGGPLFRERTDIILSLTILGLLAGVANFHLRNKASNIKRINVQSNGLLSRTLKIVTIILALSTTAFVKRYPVTPYQPYNEGSQSFTAGIWCVHFGLDNDMWLSETRMSNLIREAEIDIIGLLETDTERLIGGNRDFTQKIAEDLGMYADYGPGPNKHTWGAALLSKFPIVSSSHHLLPSPHGELAPAIHATLDIYGELVDVVVFHSGQEEDEEDRRLQSLELQRIMGDSERPLVLLSYLVTEPLEGNYHTYVSEASRMHDIDSTDWDRWCEYILFRDLKKVAYARISRSTITDTELQLAKFKFLTDEQREAGPDFLYGNHFVNEDEVAEDLWMPWLFRGDGVRGHRYHVFDEPRYFQENP